MTRLARVVIPGYPHHVIQRGVRSQSIFFNRQDRLAYLELLLETAEKNGIEFWSWCLMTNHLHLLAVPRTVEALARGIGEAHRRYTRRVNLREEVRGHLFQERFHSFPIQGERHLLAVMRYIERNPVRAGIVKKAGDFEWSSARYHLDGGPDPLVRKSPALELMPEWRKFLGDEPEEETDRIRLHSHSGRPLGENSWIKRMETRLSRTLLPKKGGRPRKISEEN